MPVLGISSGFYLFFRLTVMFLNVNIAQRFASQREGFQGTQIQNTERKMRIVRARRNSVSITWSSGA